MFSPWTIEEDEGTPKDILGDQIRLASEAVIMTVAIGGLVNVEMRLYLIIRLQKLLLGVETAQD